MSCLNNDSESYTYNVKEESKECERMAENIYLLPLENNE